MNEIEVLRSDLSLRGEVGLETAHSVLMRIAPLPPMESSEEIRPSSAMLAALQALGLGSAQLQAAISQASQSGSGLMVTFPPDITQALRVGTLHLMKSSSRTLPTAVNASGKIVAQGSVVAGAGAAAAGGTVAAASAATLAVAALPIVIAGAAAYAQQQQLERSLKEIKNIVQRIEERLEDTDSGVCAAAERFLSLATDALADGGFTPYLALELAAQRTAVEALYSARSQWVERFKRRLEAEQIKEERDNGRGQPWVDSVAEAARSGRLEQELTLFIRALLSRTKLSVLAAAVLAEEGRGSTAMKLMHEVEVELRSQFFDLHNRLRPLAAIAPEVTLRDRVPGVRNKTQLAHETVKALTAHLTEHVLPSIPDPHAEREVRAALGPATVAQLASDIEQAMAEVGSGALLPRT